MSQIVIPDVQTKGVGFAPILRHYFEKCGIAEIIDQNVPLDPRDIGDAQKAPVKTGMK